MGEVIKAHLRRFQIHTIYTRLLLLQLPLQFGGVIQDETSALLEALSPQVVGRFDDPDSESISITIDPGRIERVETDGALILHEASLER
jgi:hypothetical protein